MQIDDDDDDVPSASPEIQLGYEAALGRYLLAFNRLDNRVTEIIKLALKQPPPRSFSAKLDTLNRLKTSGEDCRLADVPIELMREINRERNVLAHGHFDQNQFDGRYEVVTTEDRDDYPVEKIAAFTEKADRAFNDLATVVARYEFDDEP